ncbi:hypothetical protein RJ641_008256 [Dillenia turbinata]|uniref:Uncharacterized protein n=1 Tax=Dillenia turbinata TaxID=194707 RepID=A0AAN8Z6A0_9MAGN
MQRQTRKVETRVGGRCKVRKRGGSSSSPSSILQNYRFKRAILVGKKGGSSTPVPTWKIGSKSPSPRIADCDATSLDAIKARQSNISARKLAATLWEINGIPLKENLEEKKKTESKNRERILNSKSLPLPQHLSDPSHSPVSERLHQGRGVISHRRRASDVSQKLQLTNYTFGGLDSFGNTSLMEIENHCRGHTTTRDTMGTKTLLKNVGKSLATSKELLKALNHIWRMEEQNSSSMTLVAALRAEIDRARIQVEQLIQDQRSSRHEINCLMNHFAEEKSAWKRRERDRIQGAIESIARELEIEKKLRRQTERLNKKLGKELADTKASMLKVVKELESERRTKEILEQVCDELARGVGEDRAEFEELKRESAKVRDEVEKEREMLQLADVLREERVQMKLSEAKYQFEEKNAAVEKLRKQLESYLGNKINRENGDEDTLNSGSGGYGAYLMKNHPGSCQNGEVEYDDDDDDRAVAEGEEREGEDSADSDLHSIELNMDNISKSYKWIYSCRDGDPGQEDSKRSSVDEMFKGRKSLSEKVQWGSISLTKGNSNSVQLESTTKTQGNTDTLDQERSSEPTLQRQRKR